MKNGLIYLCKNREIKTIEFLNQRQSYRELATLINEDFFPLFIRNDDYIDFSVLTFLGDKENPAEFNSPEYYQRINLFIDYVINNKSFDPANVPDSQFIPKSTEIFISYNNPPSSGGGGSDYSAVLGAILNDLKENTLNSYSIRDTVLDVNHLVTIVGYLNEVRGSTADTSALSLAMTEHLATIKADATFHSSLLVDIKSLLSEQNLLISTTNAKLVEANSTADASGVKLNNIYMNTYSSTGYLQSIDQKTPPIV